MTVKKGGDSTARKNAALNDMSKICKLSELKTGQSGIVVNISTKNKALRRRLFDMGITKGVKVKVKRTAPLGDPYDLQLRGYQLCLRKKDLMDIEVMNNEK